MNKTVMQRWHAVKDQVLAQAQRLAACALEAHETVRANCGQALLSNTKAFTVMVTASTSMEYRINQPYSIVVGWTRTDLDLSAHWAGTLAQWESIEAQMATINTGTLLARWEAKQ
jgi:hypothetical protein